MIGRKGPSWLRRGLWSAVKRPQRQQEPGQRLPDDLHHIIRTCSGPVSGGTIQAAGDAVQRELLRTRPHRQMMVSEVEQHDRKTMIREVKPWQGGISQEK